jgi:hypothetical protein
MVFRLPVPSRGVIGHLKIPVRRPQQISIAAHNQKRTITMSSAQWVSRLVISVTLSNATLRNMGYLTTRSVPIR